MKDIGLQLSQDLIRELLETIKSTKAFVISQAPDVIQQLYKWKMFEAIINIFGGLFCIIWPLVVGWYLHKYWQDKNGEDNAGMMVFSVIVGVIGIISAICGFMFFVDSLSVFFKIWFAPKIVLIEYLSALIK